MGENECGLGRGGKKKCLFDAELKLIIEAFNQLLAGKGRNPIPSSTTNPLKQLIEHTQCDDEKCVVDTLLEVSKGTEFEPLLYRIRELAFKIDGPSELDALLDNFILHRIARQICYNMSNKPNKPICKFAGVLTYDFNIPPATTQWASPNMIVQSCVSEKWNQMQFIFNTDHRMGGGIHWTALTIDTSIHEINYFDSYGNLPLSGWIEGTKTRKYPDGLFPSLMLEWINTVIIEFTKISMDLQFTYNETCHQEDTDYSNCGPYCLLYLYWRANGCCPTHINAKPIHQDQITSMRSKLYNPDTDYNFPMPRDIE